MSHSGQRRVRSRKGLGAAAVCALLAVAACSSSASGGGGPGASDKLITLGYVGDLTGPIAALVADGAAGAQARIDLQNARGGIDGRKIVLKAQDTQSSPTNVLTAAQTLVTQDHAFGIIEYSCVFEGAVPYLKQQNVPVVTGYPCDGYEWADHSNTNLIDAAGASTADASSAYQGLVLKEAGITKLATVTAGAPAAGPASEEAIAAAAKAVGIKVVYVNDSETTPATALPSVAVAVQRSGADGVSIVLFHSTDNLSLIDALKAQGVKSVNYVPANYNPALLSDASTRAALEGQVTTFPWAPLELNTAATKAFSAAIKKYEPSIGSPGLGAYDGWVGADAMIAGMLAAGKDLTQASVLDKLHAMTNYTAGGLTAGPVDLAVDKQGSYESGSTGNCGYALKVASGEYQMLSTKPICGPPSAG